MSFTVRKAYWIYFFFTCLTNCKTIAPNRLTFPKFFPAFQEKILLLSLLLQIKKSLKKRTKLLRTSLYASILALFLLLARRQNHCAKLLSVTKAFFVFYSKKSVSSLFLLLLSLSNCKIIAPNYCPRLRLFLPFTVRKAYWIYFFFFCLSNCKIIAPNY